MNCAHPVVLGVHQMEIEHKSVAPFTRCVLRTKYVNQADKMCMGTYSTKPVYGANRQERTSGELIKPDLAQPLWLGYIIRAFRTLSCAWRTSEGH